MSAPKLQKDMGRCFSGDAGYCHYKKAGRGITVEWFGDTVISVDCEHDFCGYSDMCAVYKRHPIGFVRKPYNPSPSNE